MSQKRNHEFVDPSSDEEEENAKKTVPMHIKKQDKRLVIVLENANLETVKKGNSHDLLNSEDHMGILRKRKESGLCRPDITHQCLLMLFDSPLNRAGLLQVYIHTEKNNTLIEINPQTRIPRTFKRFAALMVQLLHKLKIRSSDGNHRLMKVIKNPITDHLPVGCKKLCTSYSAKKIVNPRELVPPDEPIVIVVGAMAHGQVNIDYTEDTVAISGYPLSAALTCSKLCSAFEEVWGIQ
ncbi:ribosomal RNA small subunit methyltransferase NEP1-like [Argiope bruennichi]|uniref:18S rRNA (pseudouridine-N1)-methyltransferase n=1 Tax=Argiope bruennichi TaxID=94029 RepID=A0A8T0E5P8_ARGBR|nr:ribosomal RNA small subunit methyltransferase NEP1-like [Argiope bruennichi]KAF8766660.1 Ribosomal RNA small subunit methyltransferase like protein [Argiope bruennichi]